VAQLGFNLSFLISLVQVRWYTCRQTTLPEQHAILQQQRRLTKLSLSISYVRARRCLLMLYRQALKVWPPGFPLPLPAGVVTQSCLDVDKIHPTTSVACLAANNLILPCRRRTRWGNSGRVVPISEQGESPMEVVP